MRVEIIFLGVEGLKIIMNNKVNVIKYTGTIESYNELVDAIWEKNSNYYYIGFINEKGDLTPKFTGIVRDGLKGVIYKPGDHFTIKLETINEK